MRAVVHMGDIVALSARGLVPLEEASGGVHAAEMAVRPLGTRQHLVSIIRHVMVFSWLSHDPLLLVLVTLPGWAAQSVELVPLGAEGGAGERSHGGVASDLLLGALCHILLRSHLRDSPLKLQQGHFAWYIHPGTIKQVSLALRRGQSRWLRHC